MIGRRCKAGNGLSQPVLIARDLSFGKDAKKEKARMSKYSNVSFKKNTAVVLAVWTHLYPFRTEKLNALTPMVLPHQVGE